jgi:hypothetical protein
VFAITVAFLWAAAVLRSVLAFDGRQRLLAVALLAVWLLLVLAVPRAVRVWRPWFILLLIAQSAVILVLLTQSDSSDYFAVLLAAPTMQAMERWRPRAVALLIAAFTGLGLASGPAPRATCSRTSRLRTSSRPSAPCTGVSRACIRTRSAR